jgi:hypothetical protein
MSIGALKLLKNKSIYNSVMVREQHGSIPESGQRGMTQDHMQHASGVQIPLLPHPIVKDSWFH